MSMPRVAFEYAHTGTKPKRPHCSFFLLQRKMLSFSGHLQALFLVWQVQKSAPHRTAALFFSTLFFSPKSNARTRIEGKKRVLLLPRKRRGVQRGGGTPRMGQSEPTQKKNGECAHMRLSTRKKEGGKGGSMAARFFAAQIFSLDGGQKKVVFCVTVAPARPTRLPFVRPLVGKKGAQGRNHKGARSRGIKTTPSRWT
nr:hypothetical protein [Pandoravirus massiliensis]